jgi:hypothetical protein
MHLHIFFVDYPQELKDDLMQGYASILMHMINTVGEGGGAPYCCRL